MIDIKDIVRINYKNNFLPLKTNGRLNLQFCAPMCSSDGYGYSTENIILALDKMGVNVWLRPLVYGEIEEDSNKISKFINNNLFFDLQIIYFLPQILSGILSKYKVGFTMFETTKIPTEWVKHLNTCSLVLVPSMFCKNVFINCGVKVPVEVLDLGINFDHFYFKERNIKKDKFTFLSYARMDPRKNWQMTVDAFCEEFEKDKDTELIIKTNSNPIKKFIADKKNDKIKYIDSNFSRKNLLELLSFSDCFVFPSRGEAYGMPPREAMATGLPVIMPSFAGLENIAFDDICYPLKLDEKSPMVKADISAYNLPDICFETNIGEWCNPDFNHLKHLMRSVYENREEGYEKGKKASEFVKRFDVINTAANLIKIINHYFG